MLILISCLLFFVTSVILLVLRVARPNARYAWLISVGSAMLALVSIIIWLAQMPFDLTLPAWQPRTLFVNPILFHADGFSWPFALSISALTLSILLTSVVRSDITNSYAWAATFGLSGLGLLAVTAGNPFTLLMIWTALDMIELITQLRSADGPSNNENVVISFSLRILGSFILLWANISSITNGNTSDFQSLAPSSGLYLAIAAGLRLGVLPFHLPYLSESISKRGFGTALYLTSAVSSLILLARIPVGGLSSIFTPYLITLAIITALYCGWMWLRAPNELAGRPYWVIGLASLSVIAALSGNPLGAAAWGCALILVGGALFLASIQHVWMNRALLVGVWSLSSLPFSLTASAWLGSLSFFTPFIITAQALLIAGFIRHALQPGKRDSIDSQENWTKRIYPAGILLLITLQILLGLVGWDGARQVGAWLQAIFTSIVTAVLVWATPRFRILNPIRAEWEKPVIVGSSIYGGLWTIYSGIERISQAVIVTLEGEGGIMWTLLFLILFISLMTQRLP